jgi:hypothetical protein
MRYKSQRTFSTASRQHTNDNEAYGGNCIVQLPYVGSQTWPVNSDRHFQVFRYFIGQADGDTHWSLLQTSGPALQRTGLAVNKDSCYLVNWSVWMIRIGKNVTSFKLPTMTVRQHYFDNVSPYSFSISNFRRVLNVVYFLLGNSPASSEAGELPRRKHIKFIPSCYWWNFK